MAAATIPLGTCLGCVMILDYDDAALTASGATIANTTGTFPIFFTMSATGSANATISNLAKGQTGIANFSPAVSCIVSTIKGAKSVAIPGFTFTIYGIAP